MNDREHITAALTGQWAAIAALTEQFDRAQWNSPTPCPGWAARDVVAHMLGTELMLAGEPTPDVELPALDHVHNDIGRVNEKWVAHLRDLDTATLLKQFRDVTSARADTLAAMTDAEFDAPSWTPEGPGTFGGFMRIRTFDCWMHEQDLRDAVDSPGGDAGAAAQLSQREMVGKLGYIVGKRAAAPDGSTVTVALTGPHAQTLHLQVDGRARMLDQAPADPSVTLTLPASVFARRYGGRITAAQAGAATRIEGDGQLGARILEALAITM